jgi:hypothetical protein
MKAISEILIQAFRRALDNEDDSLVDSITLESNIFEMVDSFVIVSILLETESLLESETGNYVTLADETIFDADKSPFRTWIGWVDYVKVKHGIQ